MGDREAVAIVPAYNEASRVDLTVAALRSIERVRRVLVVDDGSSDDTAAKALRAGASCVSLGKNGGKGDALNAGVATVRGYVMGGKWPVPDAVLFADADLGPGASELRRLLDPVLAGHADLAIADLPPQPGAGGFGVVKRLARWGLSANGAGTVREPLSGQRVVSWPALNLLTPVAPGFGVEVQMTLDALRAGLRIAEITIPLTHAVTGKGLAGSLHRASQAVAVLRVIARSHAAIRSPMDPVRRWASRAAREAAVDRRPRQ
jgi:glycosyltransferase involved in cell wall biosynthesis